MRISYLCNGNAMTASWYSNGSRLFADNVPLTRYVKLRNAHAPGMPGTFSPPPWVSDPDVHHGTCVTHVPWCMPGLLTSGFLWSRWRGKRSRRMRNPQFDISGKRPMADDTVEDGLLSDDITWTDAANVYWTHSETSVKCNYCHSATFICECHLQNTGYSIQTLLS